MLSNPKTGEDVGPIPAPEHNETNSTDASGSGMGMDNDEVLIPFREPHDITLVSPGSSLLLYFFTDAAVNMTGFNVSYWYGLVSGIVRYWVCVYESTVYCARVNYTCPEDCMGRGNCSEEGTCECVEGWRGEWCQVPACPNNCFNNGQCTSDGCQCQDEFTG